MQLLLSAILPVYKCILLLANDLFDKQENNAMLNFILFPYISTRNDFPFTRVNFVYLRFSSTRNRSATDIKRKGKARNVENIKMGRIKKI